MVGTGDSAKCLLSPHHTWKCLDPTHIPSSATTGTVSMAAEGKLPNWSGRMARQSAVPQQVPRELLCFNTCHAMAMADLAQPASSQLSSPPKPFTGMLPDSSASSYPGSDQKCAPAMSWGYMRGTHFYFTNTHGTQVLTGLFSISRLCTHWDYFVRAVWFAQLNISKTDEVWHFWMILANLKQCESGIEIYACTTYQRHKITPASSKCQSSHLLTNHNTVSKHHTRS